MAIRSGASRRMSFGESPRALQQLGEQEGIASGGLVASRRQRLAHALAERGAEPCGSPPPG